jgi:hypothetical protein
MKKKEMITEGNQERERERKEKSEKEKTKAAYTGKLK